MAEFTKEEQIQAIYDLKVGYTLGYADIAILKAMARQLLASMEQEPVYQVLGDGSWTDYSKQQLEDLLESKPSTLFRVAYAAPQLPQPAVPECFARFHEIIRNRHHGRMPEEVQSAFDECAAMLHGAESSESRCTIQPAAELDSSPKNDESRCSSNQGAEPVSQPYTLPANVIDALEKALQAMSFMGDTLNALDAVCEEDVEYVTPAFEAVREVLEFAEPPQGWIPCSERMPEFYFSVLATDEHEDMVIALPVYLDAGDRCAFQLSNGDIFIATHWMTLPASPQQSAES